MDTLDIIDLEIRPSSIIKVMGVGGGGCNAVNYLYRQGVEDITFLVCNTDRQALEKSPVPSKLQLGKGLGAGGRPEAACAAAEESRENIRQALDDGTQMLFITAGMGGGTGTGASPVVAEVAQELGILTVAIVTIPFAFEGKRIIRKAFRGIAQLAAHVDAILVINNEKLKLIYPDFDLPNAFNKSDEVVSNAAKSIAEIITVPGYINTDFQDVYNTLTGSGVAIMNVGTSNDTEQRVTKAIQAALNSPLINTTDVQGAKRILLNFYCSEKNAIRMTELDQINEFIDTVGDEVEVKWGASYDESLGDEVRVTLIATGYPVTDIPGIEEATEDEKNNQTADFEVERVAAHRPTVDEAVAAAYGTLLNKPEVPFTIDEPVVEETITEQPVGTEETTVAESVVETEATAPVQEIESQEEEVLFVQENPITESVYVEEQAAPQNDVIEFAVDQQPAQQASYSSYNFSAPEDPDTILIEETEELPADDDQPAWKRRRGFFGFGKR